MELLEVGCDVSAVDVGGRSVVQLIATNDATCAGDTGSVLLWTPRQYATYSKNWRFVTRLPETNVDRSVLDMTTKGTRSTLH